MKKKKYQVLSPDGFTIERDVTHYESWDKALNAFNEWKKRYEPQGYYSSTKHGRIHLDDLIDFCEFIIL
jgi:Mn-containing catalase